MQKLFDFKGSAIVTGADVIEAMRHITTESEGAEFYRLWHDSSEARIRGLDPEASKDAKRLECAVNESLARIMLLVTDRQGARGRELVSKAAYLHLCEFEKTMDAPKAKAEPVKATEKPTFCVDHDDLTEAMDQLIGLSNAFRRYDEVLRAKVRGEKVNYDPTLGGFVMDGTEDLEKLYNNVRDLAEQATEFLETCRVHG